MTGLKKLVEQSYDQNAQQYAVSSQMQSASLTKLIAAVAPHIDKSRPARVLDVGCGTGGIARELASHPTLQVKSYLGIDLSKEMIAIARANSRSNNTEFAQGDAEKLPVTPGSFDLALSNSALHWLNQPSLGSTPQHAFLEIARSLSSGGVFGASLAAVGTGRKFRRSYLEVMEKAQRSVADFESAKFMRDPIGCVHLHEAVDWASTAGMKVLFARMDYEPVVFARSVDYCDAVRAYGYSVFMAAVPERLKEDIWRDVCRTFMDSQPPGPYLHDQYMCYLVTSKVD